MLRRRLVRLHVADHDDFSIEGVHVGTDRLHYRLRQAKHVTKDGSYALSTSDAPAGEVWVPRKRVLYVQVIG